MSVGKYSGKKDKIYLFSIAGNIEADNFLKMITRNPNFSGFLLALILDNTVPGKPLLIWRTYIKKSWVKYYEAFA
jgi:hypothetical protein